MKTYIIGTRNSVGLVVGYLDDGNNRLMSFTNLSQAEDYLLELKEERLHWADYEVIELIPLKELEKE